MELISFMGGLVMPLEWQLKEEVGRLEVSDLWGETVAIVCLPDPKTVCCDTF